MDPDVDVDGTPGEGDIRQIVRDIFSGAANLHADLNGDGRVSAADLAAFARLLLAL